MLEILFSPTAELVHLLTDAVLDVVLIMIDNGYVPFMQEQIPALMDKFFSILSQRYCSQNNYLVQEDKIQVNAFVLTQHKLIIKACGNLCQQAPEQMVPYINKILEFLQPQNYLASDFGKTCKIFFSLPLIAAAIGSREKYEEYN